MHPGFHRDRAEGSWQTKALAYALAATLAAISAGALLGALGSAVPQDGRVAAASTIAVFATAVGALDLSSRHLPLLQCNRETSQRGMRIDPLWLVRNGTALGIGATSRIGFWLWYLVPVSALLVGNPALGGLVYGAYGFVRGWAVWLLLLGLLTRVAGGDPVDWLMARYGTVRRLTSGYLMVVGMAVTIVVGL